MSASKVVRLGCFLWDVSVALENWDLCNAFLLS